MARHSSQPKPQSIVHHLTRLGAKVARPLSFHCRNKSWAGDVSMRSNTEISVSASLKSSKSLPRMVKTRNSLVDWQDSVSVGLDLDTLDDWGDSDAEEEIVHGSLSDLVTMQDEVGAFETMNQNEFLFECFISNDQSDLISFVHFFNEDSKISGEIESAISRVVKGSSVNCHCIRVDARLAPLFTMKLGIDPEQPTVIAIRNGTVIEKVSDFSSGVREEIEHWIEAKDFLNHPELMMSLSNLSTSKN